MNEPVPSIPEDILEAAMEALKAARPAYDTQEQYDAHWLAVSRALLSERLAQKERDAKIADEHAKAECSIAGGSQTDAMRLGAQSIAAAIRSAE